MALSVYPRAPRADASAWLAFDGPPEVLVTWSLVTGAGRIEALSAATDRQGRAWAIYYPEGNAGPARVRVDYGT